MLTNMSSHEYAEELKKLAEFLLSRPAFNAHWGKLHETFYFYSNKEDFLAAVAALKPGKKEFTENEVQFFPTINSERIVLKLEANRTTVCKLVKPAEYDCQSLLDASEEKLLENV